jgi:hypothetical protein
LSEADNTKQLTEAVNGAVDKANKHSDEQFGKVQDNVGGVDKKVSAVGDSLNQTATALSSDIQRTSDAIQKTSDRLDASIGRVGKPDPPELANVQFSLWQDGGIPDSEFPLEAAYVPSEPDGSYKFAFVVRNVSKVPAEGIDVWINICQTCVFAKDPEGFEKPRGIDDRTRHAAIGDLNRGVAWQQTTVYFKGPVPWTAQADVSFSWTCKNCPPAQTTKEFLLTLGPPPKLP